MMIGFYFVAKAWLPDSNWLKAESWDTLTADKWNKLIPTWMVASFNLTSCPTWRSEANWTSNTLDLRWEFIRWLDRGRNVDTGRALASRQESTTILSTTTSAHDLVVNNSDGNLWLTSASFYQAWNNGSNSNCVYYRIRPRNVALLFCVKD